MKLRQKIGLVLLLLTATMYLSGCTDAWIGQADSLIAQLLPAIQTVIALLLAFGVKIPPVVLETVQKAAGQVRYDLMNVVKPLLDEYKTATDPALKQSLLEKMKVALQVVLNDWSGVLGAIHIEDGAVQTKVVAILSLVESLLAEMVSIIPVIQGKMSLHDPSVHMPLQPAQFKRQFNRLLAMDPQPDEPVAPLP